MVCTTWDTLYLSDLKTITDYYVKGKGFENIFERATSKNEKSIKDKFIIDLKIQF